MLSPILACENVAASIEFYVKSLGFSQVWAMTDDNDQPNFACVKLGDAEILLGVTAGFVAAEDMRKRGIGIQIYVQVPKEIAIDDLYQQATNASANITRAIETRDWGERVFSVKDPDGYHLMFAQQV